MMKKILLPFAIVVLMLTSCKQHQPTLTSTGLNYEIIVVCDQPLYNDVVYPVLNKELRREIDGLPESEPEFSLINTTEQHFTRMLQSHHNVLIIKVDTALEKTKVDVRDNVWSKPQKVINIYLPKSVNFEAEFEKYADNIRGIFNKNAEFRFQTQTKDIRANDIEKTIKEKMSVAMEIPKDFYLAKVENDFCWLRFETTEMSMGLLIYTQEYKDTAQFSLNNIIKNRNLVTSENIPGPADGSYMIAETEMHSPSIKNIDFNGNYCKEVRGLWKVHGDFMGGPYVNYTILDTINNRIVNLDGFVYNPNKNKRNFVRRLESICKTAKFSKVNTNSEKESK